MAFYFRLQLFASDQLTRRPRPRGRPLFPAPGNAFVISGSEHHHDFWEFIPYSILRHGNETTHGFAMVRILVGVFGGRADLLRRSWGYEETRDSYKRRLWRSLFVIGNMLRLSSGYFALFLVVAGAWMDGKEWRCVPLFFFGSLFSCCCAGHKSDFS